MVDVAEILTDLHEESSELDDLITNRAGDDWRRDTAAEGWTVAHQVSHLAWTDHVALLAVTNAGAFAEELAIAAANPTGFVDKAAEEGLAPPVELLARWRKGRADLAAALARTPAGTRLPWFMTSMTPASMATGRLMETWAHGEDIAAALGEVRLPTNRLRHVAYLGVKTMAHGFLVHGRPAPGVPVYVELRAPDGDTWAYGPPDAENRLTGPAVDFCQLVTQRRHPDDLALEATGPVATEWLGVAQTFAGPPGAKRPPTNSKSES